MMSIGRIGSVGVIAAFSTLLVACGGSSATGRASGSVDGSGGSGGSGPSPAADGGVSDIGPGADPCDPFSSGYEGDSQCMKAPAPDKGFQLHYGPASYDDPAELANFMIQPSDELVDCMFAKTPNPDTVHVNYYHSRLRPGTHHMITYVQPTEHADSTKPEPCAQGPSFTFLVGATSETTDISPTGKNNAPEFEGSALKIGARSQAAIQMHFINTTDHPRLKEGWINVLYVPENEVKLEVNPITWLGGLGMSVPPKAHQVVQAGGDGCIVPDGEDRDIITLVAHAHANTSRVAAFIQRAGSDTKEKVYEDYNWEEPTFVYYNTKTENAPPDPVKKVTGGFSGRLTAHAGDKLSWECDVTNPWDNITLHFSDKAFEGEMCNMFGVYAPSTGGPWSCLSF
jgi:hypothetical protein